MKKIKMIHHQNTRRKEEKKGKVGGRGRSTSFSQAEETREFPVSPTLAVGTWKATRLGMSGSHSSLRWGGREANRKLRQILPRDILSKETKR